MNVTEKSRIKAILRRFPTAEDAFGWYGIEVDGFHVDTTVDEIAREYRMDVDDLIGDLQAHIDDAKRDRDPDEEEFDDDDDDDFDDDEEEEDEEEEEAADDGDWDESDEEDEEEEGEDDDFDDNEDFDD